MTDDDARGPLSRGVLWMVAAALAFATMNALVKLVSGHGVPTMEIAAVRAAVGAAVVFGLARRSGTSLRIVNRRTMVVRTIAGTASMICAFHAIGTLPLGESTALLNTTPLFVAGLGIVLLRERVSPRVALGLALGFLGVLALLASTSDLARSFSLDAAGLRDGAVGLASGALSAFAMVTLRRLGRTETPEAVVVHFSAWAAVAITAIAAPHAVRPSWRDALLMVLTGVAATLGQLWMTRAYAMERAARASGGNYVAVAAGAALGVLFFGEHLPWTSMLGIGMILGAGALVAVRPSGAAREG